MEVILPPDFDKGLLLYDRPRNGSAVILGCDTNGHSAYAGNGAKMQYYYLSESVPAVINSDNYIRYLTAAPPKAIWCTKNYTSYSPKDLTVPDNTVTGGTKYLLSNLVRPLADIPMKKEPFSGFPESEYCVIQNNNDHEAYQLSNIGDCPITAPAAIDFLNSHLSSYNGEQAYKIIRRQVLLVKLVGKSAIKSKEFQELLLVDCDTLEREVNVIATNLQLGLYRCYIVERLPLLEALHLKLVCKSGGEFLNKNVPAPMIAAISAQADKLILLVNQLVDIANSAEEISRLRDALNTASDDKDSVNKQLIDSSNTIAELRAAKYKANSEIDMQNSEISVHIMKIKSLELQVDNLSKTEKNLNNIIRKLKDENSKLIKRVNVLEVNAAKDEALIFNLRAEKAHWNSNNTKSFEEEQRRNKEIQELKNRINELL